MNRRQRIYWTAAAILLLGGVLLFLANPSSEPTYREKNAAQWFRKFRQAKLFYVPATGIPQVAIPTWGVTNAANDAVQQRLSGHSSMAALRALGTNSALYLAGEIRRPESRLSTRYRNFYRKISNPLRRFLPKPGDSSSISGPMQPWRLAILEPMLRRLFPY